MAREDEDEFQDSKPTEAPAQKAEGDGFDIDLILFALSPKRGVGLYHVIQMTLIMFCLPSIAFSVLSIVFIGK
jgi:hypothetical protein